MTIENVYTTLRHLTRSISFWVFTLSPIGAWWFFLTQIMIKFDEFGSNGVFMNILMLVLAILTFVSLLGALYFLAEDGNPSMFPVIFAALSLFVLASVGLERFIYPSVPAMADSVQVDAQGRVYKPGEAISRGYFKRQNVRVAIDGAITVTTRGVYENIEVNLLLKLDRVAVEMYMKSYLKQHPEDVLGLSDSIQEAIYLQATRIVSSEKPQDLTPGFQIKTALFERITINTVSLVHEKK